MEKSALEMFDRIKRSKEPVPTAELDFHSLTGDEVYGHIVMKTMRKLAENDESLTATIYTYECGSVNFAEQTWSVFFAVCGDHDIEIVQAIGRAFQAAGARARSPSDFALVTSSWLNLCHIEDGTVWTQLDPATWTDEI